MLVSFFQFFLKKTNAIRAFKTKKWSVLLPFPSFFLLLSSIGLYPTFTGKHRQPLWGFSFVPSLPLSPSPLPFTSSLSPLFYTYEPSISITRHRRRLRDAVGSLSLSLSLSLSFMLSLVLVVFFLFLSFLFCITMMWVGFSETGNDPKVLVFRRIPKPSVHHNYANIF